MSRRADRFAYRSRRRGEYLRVILNTFVAGSLCILCAGCAHPKSFDPSTVTFLIETMPANLDPRIGADTQAQRKRLCSQVQKIVAEELPYLNLWLTDNVSVHRRGLGPVELSPTGDYDFLTKIGWQAAR